jgi:TfoX/Sxy family transcriptional regulator of competence genes
MEDMRMAYNLDLEDKIDRQIGRIGEIAKKKMFGGIGYLINGNMCFGIHKESLVLRTSPEKAEELMRSEYVTPFDITGRPMKGWVLVSPDAVETEDQLLAMLRLGVSFAETLPKK